MFLIVYSDIWVMARSNTITIRTTIMILMDLSNIVYSTIAMGQKVLFGTSKPSEFEGIIRHMILNTLRANLMLFKGQHGPLVIAVDSPNSWRKQWFPYYKANRKVARDASKMDWKALFKIVNTVTDEIDQYFPYPLIKVDRAEADDCIGHLARSLPGTKLIISADKDFGQLHCDDVSQYDPIRKRFLKQDDPARFLKELILRGDRVDGIPNVLSKDDVLVVKETKQKKMMSDKVVQWLDMPVDQYDEAMLRGWQRNETLIDLTKTPDDIKQAITDRYSQQQGKDRSKLLQYMIDKQLRHLTSSISDF